MKEKNKNSVGISVRSLGANKNTKGMLEVLDWRNVCWSGGPENEHFEFCFINKKGLK